jgi:hypothetical protein
MLRFRVAIGVVLLIAAVGLGLLGLEARLAAGGERKLAAAVSGLSVLAAVALAALLTWIGERVVARLVDGVSWRRTLDRAPSTRPSA